ncbi:MAG: PHP domain-containing protein [Desulfobacula sp.]|nr:PHP domain-containing protein [Desulfobacula sp.]
MNIINSMDHGDYHLHSSTLSDGLNSIDEIVIRAGLMNYTEIAITDHNREYMDRYGFSTRTHYSIIASGRWKNIHNPVQVIFGVEADLLNEKGDICRDIQGFEPEFTVLSSHERIYQGSPGSLKTAYLNAIDRYGPAITLLGHLCAKPFSNELSPKDIQEIVAAADRAGIALELNCANLANGKTSLPHLGAMLSCCKSLYVNSDAHTLHEFQTVRHRGFAYLKENHYI